jgi:GNAT superfamily N-acetyltransferase
MSYNFIRTDLKDADANYDVLRACGKDLKVRFGFTHWDPPIPKENFDQDVADGKVYSIFDEKQLIATITASPEPLEYFTFELWSNPTMKAMYVNHLGVLPEHQGKGVGTWCMKKVEELALSENCAAMRLDAYVKNKYTVKFYDNLGYERREVIMYGEIQLLCFEKLL